MQLALDIFSITDNIRQEFGGKIERRKLAFTCASAEACRNVYQKKQARNTFKR
jgi:hypothetical protein